MAASSVGYTIAVPAPSRTAATAQVVKVVPAAISHLRPIRSDSAPVPTCPAPQRAGRGQTLAHASCNWLRQALATTILPLKVPLGMISR